MPSLILITFITLCVGASIYAVLQTLRSRHNINRHLAFIREQQASPKSILSKDVPVVSLTQDDWGKLEGAIDNLELVMVVADEIQPPTQTLREAVRKNFINGVRYIFFISHSKVEKEINHYYRDFVTEAHVARDNYQVTRDVSDMVQIHKLPYDWNDYPYVFYRYKHKSAETGEAEQRTIALRGNTRHAGISNIYESVRPEIAHTLATVILSQVPMTLSQSLPKMEQEEFTEPINVIRAVFRKEA